MTKLLFARISALLLLLVNILLVVFVYLKRPPTREGPKMIIIEKLHFNDVQIQAYEKLIDSHRAAVREADKELMDNKKNLYATLTESPSDSLKNSLIEKIVNAEQEIENIHYEHFLEIKKLCSTDQLPAFAELTKELSSYFSPKPPRKK